MDVFPCHKCNCSTVPLWSKYLLGILTQIINFKSENHKIGPKFQIIQVNQNELEQNEYNWQNLRKLRLKISKLFEKLRLDNCLAIAYFLAQSQPDCL